LVEDAPTSGESLFYKDSCGAGKTLISIDALGYVYPCHMLQDPSLNCGNMLNEEWGTIIRKMKTLDIVKCNVDSLDGCKGCGYRYFCGGGCKARGFYEARCNITADPYCKAYQHELRKYANEVDSLINFR